MTTAPVLKSAWDRYLATLDEMRVLIEASPQFAAVPEQRPKAHDELMGMQAMACNLCGTMFLDGSQTSRLIGRIDDSRLLIAQLNPLLPANTRNVTTAERARELQMRRAAYLRSHGAL